MRGPVLLVSGMVVRRAMVMRCAVVRRGMMVRRGMVVRRGVVIVIEARRWRRNEWRGQLGRGLRCCRRHGNRLVGRGLLCT
jgi:hypothetical protein